MKRKLFISTVLLAFILGACAYNASLVNTSYKIQAVSQASYDTSMKMVADLDKRGMLPEDEKAKILVVANTYYQAHNAAVKALLAYKESESLADKELLEKQIALMSTAIADLLAIISPYLEEV